ncbi:uncharacterized protein TNCV_3583951 [Trichonephila clavipes]|nr:uncharacterized protein TNCV_3583951 [Trichonephila clavipes]
MKSAIYATLYHCSSKDAKPKHNKCPNGKLSWCFFKRALANRESPESHSVMKTKLTEEVVAKILTCVSAISKQRDIVSVYFSCQVIYSQFGLAIHQNDHQARRRFVEWAQNEIAAIPDFHKRILFSDEAHFWLNGYVNKQNCRIWSEANPQVYVETPLHPEKLTVWCALWAGGILLQKR